MLEGGASARAAHSTCRCNCSDAARPCRFSSIQPHELPEGATVADALAAAMQAQPFAVAVNTVSCPPEHLRHLLRAGDRVEVISCYRAKAMNTAGDDTLVLYGQSFSSRLLLGTSATPRPRRSGRRATRPARHGHGLAAPPGQQSGRKRPGFLAAAARLNVPVLPNTANCQRAGGHHHSPHGARGVRHPVDQAGGHWRRLHLQPDTLNLVAAEKLVFTCRLLHRRPGAVPAPGGCGLPGHHALGGPIGTGRGPMNPTPLQVLRERIHVPMLVDAGLGLPRTPAR